MTSQKRSEGMQNLSNLIKKTREITIVHSKIEKLIKITTTRQAILQTEVANQISDTGILGKVLSKLSLTIKSIQMHQKKVKRTVVMIQFILRVGNVTTNLMKIASTFGVTIIGKKEVRVSLAEGVVAVDNLRTTRTTTRQFLSRSIIETGSTNSVVRILICDLLSFSLASLNAPRTLKTKDVSNQVGHRKEATMCSISLGLHEQQTWTKSTSILTRMVST